METWRRKKYAEKYKMPHPKHGQSFFAWHIDICTKTGYNHAVKSFEGAKCGSLILGHPLKSP